MPKVALESMVSFAMIFCQLSFLFVYLSLRIFQCIGKLSIVSKSGLKNIYTLPLQRFRGHVIITTNHTITPWGLVMNRTNKHALSIIALTAILAVSLMLVLGGEKNALSDRKGRNSYVLNKALAETMKKVRDFYYKDADLEEMYEGAIKGALAGLDDPYSFYLSERDLKRESENLYHAAFGGLGIHIYAEKGFIRIYRPLPDTPAMRAGLQAGDDIIRVNGKAIHIGPNGQTLYDIVDILRGEVGTEVTITVRRRVRLEPFDVTLTRQKIKPPSVEKTMLDDGIGYIKIWQFTGRTSEEFRDAVNELLNLKGNEMKSLILDLRHNPGGLLEAANYVADAFISDGTIVSTKGRKSRFNQTYRAKSNDICPAHIHLVVMVNEFSASGSEIVAGAIKDTNRGVILGTRTFGKGLVQQRFPLQNGGGAISLTISRYYTPNGTSINERLLFSTDLSLQRDLDNGEIPSDNLRQVFENHGLTLSQDATISVEEKDSKWIVAYQGNHPEYRIRREDGKLKVYNEKGVTPDVIVEADKLDTAEAMIRQKMRKDEYAKDFVERWIEAEEKITGKPPQDFSKLEEKLPELVEVLEKNEITLSPELIKLEMRYLFNRNVGIYQLIDLETDNQLQEAIKVIKSGEIGQILASKPGMANL